MAQSQEKDEDIVTIIDDLTIQWDNSAEKLRTYEGLMDYCRNKAYRDNTILLLKEIHHYDSSLYRIVQSKFKTSEDPEAKATLDDISTLETDYTTGAFLAFLRQECTSLNDNERNKTMDDYKKVAKELEKEMRKYVEAITKQIDVVDEHIHHLKGL
ncbi:MAG: hypothetical protein RIC30_06395 [Marinoscillum sp.]|uniref:hypothetical protein n=1 Tax=Marinoscillum sp. TaxID=2024838 RepID=UPI0032F1DEE8